MDLSDFQAARFVVAIHAMCVIMLCTDITLRNVTLVPKNNKTDPFSPVYSTLSLKPWKGSKMRMLYETELGREFFVPRDTNYLVRYAVVWM